MAEGCVSPTTFAEGRQTLFEPNLRRVVTRKTRLFRDLVLDFTEQDSSDTEAAAENPGGGSSLRSLPAEKLGRRGGAVVRATLACLRQLDVGARSACGG